MIEILNGKCLQEIQSTLTVYGDPAITDTPAIIRTAAKCQTKINNRCLTEINCRYHGFLLMSRSLAQGPYSVCYKGS